MPAIQRRAGVLFGVFFLLLLLAGARSFYLGMLGRGSTAIALAVDPGSARAGSFSPVNSGSEQRRRSVGGALGRGQRPREDGWAAHARTIQRKHRLQMLA
jgi:hypothetical protein